MASEDKSISISNSDGDTIKQTSIRDLPSEIQFSEMKMNERSKIGEDTVSGKCTYIRHVLTSDVYLHRTCTYIGYA